MTYAEKINAELQQLAEVADWCFAVGLRVRFNQPTLFYRTYPDEWCDFYDRHGLFMRDPAVRWGISNTGATTWAALDDDDHDEVLKLAAEHGLKHGIVISVGEASMRSMGFFAHTDRPISEEECRRASTIICALHEATEGVTGLDAEQINKIRQDTIWVSTSGRGA